MQGFEIMLKAMGVDPKTVEEKMNAMISQVVSQVVARFDQLERRLDSIDMRLSELDKPKMQGPTNAELANTAWRAVRYPFPENVEAETGDHADGGE